MASDTASEKFYDGKDKASDVYGEARHKVKGAMGCGEDKAVDDAKDNMGVKMEHGSGGDGGHGDFGDSFLIEFLLSRLGNRLQVG